MFHEARNIKSILWGQGMQKFPIEQLINNNSGIKVHPSNISSRESLIELALCLKPDLIIFDLAVNGNQSWSELLTAMKERLPNLGLLAIINIIEPELIYECAKIQVNGILQADKVHLELPYGIRAVQRNEVFLSPRHAKILCSYLSTLSPMSNSHNIVYDRGFLSNLTNREIEVLACLTQGLNYKQISEKLFVSNSTVKTHVNNIFTKLNVNDRTQAVLYGLKHGIDQMIPELFSEDKAQEKINQAPYAKLHSLTKNSNNYNYPQFT